MARIARRVSLFFSPPIFVKSLLPFPEAELILVAGCDFVASYNPKRPLKFWYPPSAPLWKELTRLGGRCSHWIVITGSTAWGPAVCFFCVHILVRLTAAAGRWAAASAKLQLEFCCSPLLLHRAMKPYTLKPFEALRVFFFFFIVSSDALLCSAGWSTAETHKTEKILTTQNTKAEDFQTWTDFTNVEDIGSDTTRLVVPRSRLATKGGRAFAISAPRLWNNLPKDIKSTSN